MKWISIVMLASAAAFTGGQEGPKHNYVPKDGYVPTSEVAIKIAVAVWEPIYGADNIAAEKPYRAALAGGVWTVEGSLPEGMKGGVAEAEIARADGRIMRISHGK
jgi:hypothetical protein